MGLGFAVNEIDLKVGEQLLVASGGRGQHLVGECSGTEDAFDDDHRLRADR